MRTDSLITATYQSVLPRLLRYLSFRINDQEVANDLAQDVFVKMLESNAVLFSREAGEAIVFRVARNVVNDWLRHHYVKREADAYLLDNTPTWTVETETNIWARDFSDLEMKKLSTLPTQRRTIYKLRRFEGLSAKEIADRLGISRRTVENHLLSGTHQMRDYMRNCI